MIDNLLSTLKISALFGIHISIKVYRTKITPLSFWELARNTYGTHCEEHLSSVQNHQEAFDNEK